MAGIRLDHAAPGHGPAIRDAGRLPTTNQRRRTPFWTNLSIGDYTAIVDHFQVADSLPAIRSIFPLARWRVGRWLCAKTGRPQGCCALAIKGRESETSWRDCLPRSWQVCRRVQPGSSRTALIRWGLSLQSLTAEYLAYTNFLSSFHDFFMPFLFALRYARRKVSVSLPVEIVSPRID